MTREQEDGGFPRSAGILLGLGLGGFFDGIVLHQLLQWHHMLSSWYPITSIENLKLNTLWDGLFHSLTYVLVAVALFILWRAAQGGMTTWSGRTFCGTLLLGFGIFNVVEGVVDHLLLGVHHVNETVPRSQWFAWDLGFILWGAAMIAAGWMLMRRGQRQRDAHS